MADGNQSLSAFWRAYARVVLAVSAVTMQPETARRIFLDPLTREIVRAHTYSATAHVNMYHLRRKRPRMRTVRRLPLLATSNCRLCSSMPPISCSLHGATEITMTLPPSSPALCRTCQQIRTLSSGRRGTLASIAGGKRLVYRPLRTIRASNPQTRQHPPPASDQCLRPPPKPTHRRRRRHQHTSHHLLSKLNNNL